MQKKLEPSQEAKVWVKTEMGPLPFRGVTPNVMHPQSKKEIEKCAKIKLHDGASYIDILVKEESADKKYSKSQVFWSEEHQAYVSVLSHNSEKKQCECKFVESTKKGPVTV